MKQIVPILLLCLALASAVGAEDSIPHDSKIARATQGGQRLLLNPLDDTSSVATGAWKMKGTEALQFVDLGRVREIRKLTWLSGDANHSWFVDVSASEDGKNYCPAPGLSNVVHHQKWGWREFPLERPFKARLVKFCYRTAGGREDLIAFPSELGVYDGADDEAVALPNVGPLIEDGQISVDVPARSFAVQALTFAKPLQSGA